MLKIIQNVMNKYKSMSTVTKATFWFFACNILTKCISLITTPIFTRLLSTEQYGIYNTFMSWTQVATIIVTLRLDYGIFNKGMTQYSEDKDNYAATMQSITSILTVGAFLLYLPLKNTINALTGLTTFISIALFVEVLFSSAISYWMVKQRYDFKYKSVIAVSLSMSLSHMFIGIAGVLLTNHQAIGRILSSVLVYVCFGLIIYLYNYKKANKLFVKSYAKFALLFVIPLLPHYFASYILDQFDRIMIMKLVGYSAVGIYSVAYSCGYVIKIITSSLNNTLIPWLYQRLKANDHRAVSDCLENIVRTVSLSFLGFMAFAPELIRLFASPEYYEAIYVLPPVSASAFLIFLYELYANIEFFYNKNKFTMYIAIASAIINVILNYLCIPIWGYIAAAYTTLISYCFYSISHFVYMRYVVKKETNQILFGTTNFCFIVFGILAYTILINFAFEYTLIRYLWIFALALYVVLRRKQLFAFLSVMK